MRSIIIRFALFALPIILLLGGLEYLQRELPHDYKQKRELLEAGLGDWECLVLGSSHSYLAVNPEYLDLKSFNLAYTAQTFTFDYFLLEKYLEQMPSLKYIIYPISYPSYGSEAYLFDGIYNKTYYFKHFFGSNAFTKWYEPENYSLVSLLTVKRSVDRSMRYFKGQDTLVEFNKDGWYFWDDSMTTAQLINNGIQSGTYHNQFYDESLHSHNVALLDSIISVCKKFDVIPVLVSTPMHKSYQKEMKKSRYDFMVNTTDSLARVNDIPYLNLTESPDYERADFMDANHLGKEGARKFTSYLNGVIMNIEN
ncbi:MAG: DUF1574 domain-containing protein [Bacteroidia bacterium]|nr:DUF1574 domain-containing protein [Bacteroidia bacterium]